MTATTTQTKNSVISTAAESFGVNVWLTFQEARFNYDEVLEFAGHYGFEKMLPKPSAKKALKRATSKISKSSRRVLARNISESSDAAVMGIVNESVDGEQLDYSQGTTIRLDKTNGSIQVEGARAEEVENMYEIYRESTTSTDIRTFAINVLKYFANAIPKRPSGGIYFIPNAYLPVVQKLTEMVQVLGIGKVYIERLYNGLDEKANMWDAAKYEINKQIGELMEKVQGTGKNSSARIGRSIASLERKDADANEIESLMKIYEQVVGNEFEAEEMLNKIVTVREKIADKVVELEKRKAE